MRSSIETEVKLKVTFDDDFERRGKYNETKEAIRFTN